MPTVKDIHQDAVLTNISLQYQNPGFVADMVMPRIPVKKESDLYYIYGKERFSVPNTRRAPKSPYAKVDWSPDTDTYTCKEEGLEESIDDEERKNADKPLNLEIDTTELLTDLIALKRETRVATKLTTVANFTNYTTLSGTDQWSNKSASDPLDDVKTAVLAINAAIGLDPNTMVLPREVYEELKMHPAILDLIKYSQKGIITADLLAAIFEIPSILIAGSLKNTAMQGQTASLSRVWGKHVFIGYVEKNPGLKKITVGSTFESKPRTTKRYREEKINCDTFRVSEKVDEKLVAELAGYVIRDAVA